MNGSPDVAALAEALYIVERCTDCPGCRFEPCRPCWSPAERDAYTAAAEAALYRIADWRATHEKQATS